MPGFTMRLVLASISPRRRDLLALLDIPFEVRSPTFEERLIPGQSAMASAASFAQGKAQSVSQADPDAIVLGSDTVIELDGTVLGKPHDLAEARMMLQSLAGREHLVHTAVALVCQAHRIDRALVSTARVWMKSFDIDAHERYLATGDSLGKAGAYSIQGPGAALIERLEGDFPTVVGLPLRLIVTMLTQVGVTAPVGVERLYATKPYGNWARFPG